MGDPGSTNDRQPGFLTALRDVLGKLDLVIGILLALMLLPLVLGPIVGVYQFLQAGLHGAAAGLAALTAACYFVAGRAVKRGEFSPGTVFTVLIGAAIIVFVVVRLRP
jgi:polyferredoxin